MLRRYVFITKGSVAAPADCKGQWDSLCTLQQKQLFLVLAVVSSVWKFKQLH